MRNARGTIVSAVAAFATLVTSSCVLPPADDVMASAPSIEQIVARVKCDLVEAVAEPLLDEDHSKAWFQTWTAQVNLNFIVSDQSSISPGATFTQPLTTESLPLRVTNMARSANLGIGAGVNTTASRNETVTFSVSLREVFDDLESGQVPFGCDHPIGLDLHSELGIKKWIADALRPADEGFLISGHHKSSKGAGQAPTPGKGGSPALVAAAKFAAEKLNKASRRPTPPPAPNVPPEFPCETLASRENATVIRALAKLQRYIVKDPGDPTKNVLPYVDKIIGRTIDETLIDTRKMIAVVKKLHVPPTDAEYKCLEWAKALEDDLLPLELDPPIDTISDQIQFIIAYNASASPSWTLLHFKGPTGTSSFASATKTLTHTLNIVVGPPGSPDTVSALNALLTSTAISQQLSVTGIKLISP